MRRKDTHKVLFKLTLFNIFSSNVANARKDLLIIFSDVIKLVDVAIHW